MFGCDWRFSKMSDLIQLVVVIIVSSVKKDWASRVDGSRSVQPFSKPCSWGPPGCSWQEQLCCGDSTTTVHPACHKQNLVEGGSVWQLHFHLHNAHGRVVEVETRIQAGGLTSWRRYCFTNQLVVLVSVAGAGMIPSWRFQAWEFQVKLSCAEVPG